MQVINTIPYLFKRYLSFIALNFANSYMITPLVKDDYKIPNLQVVLLFS